MGGGASWKLAKKIFTLQRCGGSLCLTQQQQQTPPVSRDSRHYSLENQKRSDYNTTIISSEIAEPPISISTPPSSKKNLCAICLEPLKYKPGSKAIFTAQCSHAFHFSCITSNVRHGSVTCPICRARWTQLPRNPCPLHNPRPAPARTHFLRSPPQNDHPRLSFTLLTPNYHYYNHHRLLRVTLSHPPPTDLVLVAAGGSRLMKQAMALVVSSLRPVDRLSIISGPTPDARRLRRMTTHGKAAALKIIDQMSSLVRPQDDLIMKGAEILGDRAHGNPRSCILHLTKDNPSSTSLFYCDRLFDGPVMIHRFDVRGGCDGYEFEGFLARTLGGRAEDVQLRIGEGEGNMVVRIGGMRGGEERNIRLCGNDDESGRVCVKYSYWDGECVRTGDVVVVEDKGDGVDSRIFCDGNWDYQDSFMAARR